MRCKLALVANKCDLGEPPPALDEYRALGYPCFETSAQSEAGLAPLAEWLEQGIGVMVGQSGVGKSSLLNALCPGADAPVASVSQATAEGRHTTTASVMRALPQGSRLIDTPGVREFIPALGDQDGVSDGFAEIARAGVDCRFANCRHMREPQCAVKEAVSAGRISTHRYDSYKRLVNSL